MKVSRIISAAAAAVIIAAVIAVQPVYAADTENITVGTGDRTVYVEGSAERDDLTGKMPSESITVSVKDPETGAEYEAEAFYTGSELTREEWSADLTAELEFTDIDADYFDFEGVLYENTGSEPLPEEAYASILNALGFSPDRYRITGISWSGDAYTSDGTVCRKAVVSGETLHRIYTDLYAGTYVLPEAETAPGQSETESDEPVSEEETVRKEETASSAGPAESTEETADSEQNEKENLFYRLGRLAAEAVAFLTGKGAGIGITGLTLLIAAAAFLIVRAAGRRGKKN